MLSLCAHTQPLLTAIRSLYLTLKFNKFSLAFLGIISSSSIPVEKRRCTFAHSKMSSSKTLQFSHILCWSEYKFRCASHTYNSQIKWMCTVPAATAAKMRTKQKAQNKCMINKANRRQTTTTFAALEIALPKKWTSKNTFSCRRRLRKHHSIFRINTWTQKPNGLKWQILLTE